MRSSGLDVSFDIAIFYVCLPSMLFVAGVQIVDICIATRSHNGGLIDLLDLRKLLCRKRKTALESLSEDDCLRAISKLKVRLELDHTVMISSELRFTCLHLN
jgi:hypothetical protein